MSSHGTVCRYRQFVALEWVVAHAQPSGVLPEQLHPYDGTPLPVAPLTRQGRQLVQAMAVLTTSGPLSTAHAGLSQTCQACHLPFQRVADSQCLGCHAKNANLLQRRDTAFHAEATRYLTCHSEPQGRLARISRMQHAVLNPAIGCATCHVDRHQTFFGDRCVACHNVATWHLRDFRHPSARSKVGAACHQPPPSHLLGHFQMLDQALTGQADAAQYLFLRHFYPRLDI